mgnify:CR=1 FL=1
MKLNHSKLKSFFYGTLLGDSYIHNGIFYCKQISKDLMYLKYKLVKQYLPNAIIKISEHDEYTDKNGVHHQKYYLLSITGSRYIKKLEKIFYPNGKKIYPDQAILKLDWFGSATTVPAIFNVMFCIAAYPKPSNILVMIIVIKILSDSVF